MNKNVKTFQFLILGILFCSFLTDSFPSNRSGKETTNKTLNSFLNNELKQAQDQILLNEINKIIKENNPEDSPYETRQKRQIDKSARKWEHGVVYYEFHDSIDSDRKEMIEYVIDFISKKTCIKFIETNETEGRIVFEKKERCNSVIGFLGLRQPLSIGKDCVNFATVMHEFMHVLGFHHTVSRSDRDDYITIKPIGDNELFLLNTVIVETTSYVPYEYASIMHYPFKTLGEIIPKQKEYLFTIGSRIPTFYDMYALNVHYQCNEKCADKGAICYNKGYPNPNNCEECICPRGYSGSLCNEPDETTIQLNADSEWQAYTTEPFTRRDKFQVEQRSIWINAPQNGTVQIRTIKLNQFKCCYGCKSNGVQVQYSDDPRHNDPINCCSRFIENQFYTAKLNPAVINFHGNGYETFQFQYRYVHN